MATTIFLRQLEKCRILKWESHKQNRLAW